MSLSKQQQLVLDALRKNPNRTSAELAHAARINRLVTARRLPELRGMQMAKSADKRVCSITGRQSLVWTAAF